jgi:hypothetical protein
MSGRILLLFLSGIATTGNAQPPGRCSQVEASFTLAGGEHAREVMPYVNCLAGAEQRYGFNDGPYAVHQCREVRANLMSSIEGEERASVASLLDQIDRAFVWSTWCSTDVGSEIQETVEIKAGWPQAGAKGRQND